MAGKTTIEWTHMPGYEGDVWNPTTGCTRVSAGCDNCYAFALHDKRYKVNLDASHGADDGREGTRTQRARRAGAALPFPKQYDLPFSQMQLLEERLDVPLRRKKPTCYFVDSMADLFHEDVPDEFLDRAFAVMGLAYQHKFLVLTKRPERMRAYMARLTDSAVAEYRDWPRLLEAQMARLTDHIGSARMQAICEAPASNAWPHPNVWLGTSVEDQKAADERIPHLLSTPAAVRFLSCEPLLGPLNLQVDYFDGTHGWPKGELRNGSNIQWVIVGGESGPRARPMDLTWARSIRAQCRAAGDVAFFMKQLGSKPRMTGVLGDLAFHVSESHGRDMDEWPGDLRVREWPR